MTSTTVTGHRGATAAVLAIAGGALAVATWIGGQHGLALVLVAFYAVCATIAYVWSGRETDTGAILRAGGDERQRRIDTDATAIAGLAMLVVAIIGAIVSAARDGGNIGVFGLFAAIGGLTYAVALAVLQRRS
jgi:hypothetical protein